MKQKRNEQFVRVYPTLIVRGVKSLTVRLRVERLWSYRGVGKTQGRKPLDLPCA
jgi:hypothetical protein